MVRFSPLLGALHIALPSPAAAQLASPTDTSPFHRGQWAAQFGAGASFASLGFLRFSTPSRAWLVDVRLNGGHTHATSHVGDTLLTDGFGSHAVINARIGRRFYQVRGRSVAVFQSVGALGGYAHSCEEASGRTPGYASCENGWNAGAFGELGASYLVTPRFSLGGTAAVSFTYQRTSGYDSRGGRYVSWAYDGAVQGLAFSATIYF